VATAVDHDGEERIAAEDEREYWIPVLQPKSTSKQIGNLLVAVKIVNL
jgi:hypothetical protein